MSEKQDYIVVGLLGKTRGVDGDLWVTPLTDFPDRFLGLESIYVEVKNSWELMKIVSADLFSNRPVLRLKGLKNKEEATRFTNRRLAVLRSDVIGLPEDSYYVFDLIGMKVVDEATQETLGVIADVNSYPANDAYDVKLNDGTEKQLAAVEQYIKRVDLEKKEIGIDPAGLI